MGPTLVKNNSEPFNAEDGAINLIHADCDSVIRREDKI